MIETLTPEGRNNLSASASSRTSPSRQPDDPGWKKDPSIVDVLAEAVFDMLQFGGDTGIVHRTAA